MGGEFTIEPRGRYTLRESAEFGFGQEHYDLGGPASPEQVADIAEAWRPWRAWASVLVRAASGRQ